MSMTDHFRAMQKYEAWANKATLDSMESVPASARGSTQFTRALQVMAHNQLARAVWLARLEGRSEKVADWFPAWPVEQTRARAAELDQAWSALVERTGDADLARSVAYSSSEGVAYRSTVHEVLTHVYNHSTYHRGQVARLVTEAGGRRASTDFIAMTRHSG